MRLDVELGQATKERPRLTISVQIRDWNAEGYERGQTINPRQTPAERRQSHIALE
jgi:hypothetical protein